MQYIKKILIFGLILGFFCIPFIPMEEENQIRIRIIPNSNEKIDLDRKEKIKSSTTEYLQNLFLDSSPTEEDIQKNINNLSSYLIQLYGNDVVTSFESHTFPNKVVEGKIIEGGEYPTLLIKIGEAKGDNWWATLYPELFGIESDEKITYRSLLYELFD